MKRSFGAMLAYCTPLKMLITVLLLAAADAALYLFTRLNIVYILAIMASIVIYLIGFIIISAKLFLQTAKMKSSGELETALDDFSSGGHAFGNNMILGQTFVFGKNQGTVIKYEEIDRVYQHIYKYYGMDHLRLLIAIDKNGKRRYLCKLERWGGDDSEFQNMLEYLTARNPNIKIGLDAPLKESVIRQMLDYLRA